MGNSGCLASGCCGSDLDLGGGTPWAGYADGKDAALWGCAGFTVSGDEPEFRAALALARMRE
ncbi:hypothetical protein B0I29_104393 [Actinoplanes lutulentus]|uniref:Uncharacterized protein n=2 Tax=Actinoplanes lutulentus TaxID=1287878 RepID=A0A327ZG74_9ACTN|nr:hypothetical protein B0I29_104393 [Actinoplanes lutulentus]